MLPHVANVWKQPILDYMSDYKDLREIWTWWTFSLYDERLVNIRGRSKIMMAVKSRLEPKHRRTRGREPSTYQHHETVQRTNVGAWHRVRFAMRRWIGVCVVSCVGVAAMVWIGASPAYAATCYGDYCTGKNPYTTGCASNSYEWGYANIHDPNSNSAVVGDVELWISRTCATRWARVRIWEDNNYSVRVQVKQSNGFTETTPWYNGAGTYYTLQIYNRSLCSYARAIGQFGGLNDAQTGCTVW